MGPAADIHADAKTPNCSSVNSMSNPDSVGTNWRPKCARCRHHGIVTMKKGHTKLCPFLECQCSKCGLITERTKITALQRELRKAKKEQRFAAGDGDAEATAMGSPSGGAPEWGTPADPWRNPEPGGEPVSGSDMRNVPPSASGKRPSPGKLTVLTLKAELDLRELLTDAGKLTRADCFSNKHELSINKYMKV